MAGEDAAKLVISGGLVYPGEKEAKMPAQDSDLAGKIAGSHTSDDEAR